jgi:hypothetical protein
MADPITLNELQLQDILYEDDENWEAVTGEKIYGTSRWTTSYEQVFKRTTDDRMIRIMWDRGSTEYQDNGTENVSFVEVFPKQVTKTIYVTADKL